ncbi:hypothetical protein [Brachybacterium hainanense]|uniref:DUF559 domain-containing protein n=1 Tax=Brachybacterium hainanense TaxID=1541174 RepID=A0ABV6R704_9MICO
MRRDLATYDGALMARHVWRALGVHPRTLAGPAYTRVFTGYWTPTDHPASLNTMCWVLQRAILPDAVICGATAALLHGIALPAAFEDGIALLRPRFEDEHLYAASSMPAVPSVRRGASLRTGAKLPNIHVRLDPRTPVTRRRGMVIHRFESGPTAQRGRVRLSSVVEVLRELAADLPLYDLVAAIDGVIGAGQPVRGVTREDIAARIAVLGARPGIARLREALDRSRENVRSPSESVMRMLIVDAGLPEPRVNVAVLDPETGQLRVLDLVWEGAMRVLEYDGDVHRTKARWREDETRADELRALGWDIVRANGDDLLRPLRILLRVAKALRRRGIEVPSDERIRAFVASLPSRDLSLRLAEEQL